MAMENANSYKIDEYFESTCIGRGNYGTAHLAKIKANGEQVIIKKIPTELMTESEKKQAFLEAKLLSTLTHPYIVCYKTSFFESNVLHIVMSYCEGGDLSVLIKSRRKGQEFFTEKQILTWFLQMASALNYLHSKKILHRDMKSSNIFLTAQHTEIRLGDFGIARVLESTLEQARTVVGTPYYMSPEVCENKPYSYSSDIWALGCILYEMCALHHAFKGNNLLGLVFKIVQQDYDPVPAHYSQEMHALIASLLEKSPAKRPSMQEIFDIPFLKRLHKASIEAVSEENPVNTVEEAVLNQENNPVSKTYPVKVLLPPPPNHLVPGPSILPLITAPSWNSTGLPEPSMSPKTPIQVFPLPAAPLKIIMTRPDNQSTSRRTSTDEVFEGSYVDYEIEESLTSAGLEDHYSSDDFESDLEEMEVLEYSNSSVESFKNENCRMSDTVEEFEGTENVSHDRLLEAREYLKNKLGAQKFAEVYRFLTLMRQTGKTNLNGQLVEMVGREKLKYCFEVDQFIAIEETHIQ